MSQPITRENSDRWMTPIYAPTPFIPVRGEGSRLWDRQGKEYIDFAGGITVNALGHAHPELCEALNEQASKFRHAGNDYINEPVLRLTKKLIDVTFVDRVLLCSSDAEASEAALRLAHEFVHDCYDNRKSGIVAFENTFHGRMLFTVSTGGQPAYSQDSASLPPDICHTAYNDINPASALVDNATCAVIVEPIQGEGDAVPANNAFLQGLHELCNHHNALLILDKVQTGVRRTGELYTCMYYGVTPDLLTTVRVLGDGFLVGVLSATEEYASMMAIGTYSTTYGGNPLASVVAGKVLDLINTPEMLNGVKQRHGRFVECLNSINHHYNLLSEARGLGLLISYVLNTGYAGQARQISREAVRAGTMVLIVSGDVVRSVPTLNVSEEEITTGLDRFATACEHFVGRGSS